MHRRETSTESEAALPKPRLCGAEGRGGERRGSGEGVKPTARTAPSLQHQLPARGRRPRLCQSLPRRRRLEGSRAPAPAGRGAHGHLGALRARPRAPPTRPGAPSPGCAVPRQPGVAPTQPEPSAQGAGGSGKSAPSRGRARQASGAPRASEGGGPVSSRGPSPPPPGTLRGARGGRARFAPSAPTPLLWIRPPRPGPCPAQPRCPHSPWRPTISATCSELGTGTHSVVLTLFLRSRAACSPFRPAAAPQPPGP